MTSTPVTIAGAGPVARSLAERLKQAGNSARLVSTHPTDGWKADLTAIADAEVACAGARTLVVLAQTREKRAKSMRAAFSDVDALLADSLARAAQRCGVEHIILYACGTDDPREGLLRASGVPVSVLRGGGPDPAVHLEGLITRGPGSEVLTQQWTGESPTPRTRPLVCSVQRYPLPKGWSARQLADAYLDWLPGQLPTVSVHTVAETTAISAFGTRVLVLRRIDGRCEADSVVFEVADGALVRRGQPDARFEFRVLLDKTNALTALIGFEPQLPWPVYQLTQALMHERVMRRFGTYLSTVQNPPSP